MTFTACDLPGLIVCEPTVFGDSRGYFYEAYNQTLFQKNGIEYQFVQDNQSRSSYGVIRGLHYQLNPFAQVKLVRVLEGSILDVAVDIRKGSPTYGKHFSIELSAENKSSYLYLPGLLMAFLSFLRLLLFYINVINFTISRAKAEFGLMTLN